MMGSLLVIPEAAGGSFSSLESPSTASSVSQSELSFGLEFSGPGPEATLTDLVVLAEFPTVSEEVLVVWAGLGASGSLVVSDPPPFVSSLVSDPISHTFISGLGFRNGLELDLIPEVEPSPLSCCPSDKVRGFSGKGSLELLLKMALEYRHPLGITCDGSEGQISTLYEDMIASHVKKESGFSSKLGIKGTRELNRLFCSINYDAHSGSSSSGRRKGRVHDNLL
jgi:hypothetical protein